MTKHKYVPKAIFDVVLEKWQNSIAKEYRHEIQKEIDFYINNSENYSTDFGLVELYVLRDYDGGDGRGNNRNGMVTRSKHVAEAWNKSCNGNSYDTISGVIINDINEISEMKDELLRQKTLKSLSQEQKRVLGLL